MTSETATLQGALRFVKRQLGLPVLVGLRDRPYGDGWASQHMCRMSSSEQLALLNDAVATIDKPRSQITVDDIQRALTRLLHKRVKESIRRRE